MYKKLIYALFILLFAMSSCTEKPQKYSSFHDYPVYEGNDLEYTYTPNLTTFKLWSPEAEQVKVHIYDAGLGGDRLCSVDMDYDGKGVWSTSFDEDLKGKFYTFQILFEGNWLDESVGAYAKAVGVNGVRGAVIDMAETNFLCYKGKPLVRKGNEIYYGDMSEKCVVKFEILSAKKDGKLEIADKVSVQLLDSNTDNPMKDRIKKASVKDNLFTALDLGLTWLERALKE